MIVPGNKFNNKIGHAIPYWQYIVATKPKKVACWDNRPGNMFQQIGEMYKHLHNPELITYATEEEYVEAGYDKQCFIYNWLYELDQPFVRPKFESKNHFQGRRYITFNAASAAPERSLKHNPMLDLNCNVVNLDPIRTDMVTLHQIIEGADRHYGINSGPAWIAATVGTPVTLLEFDENRTDWSCSPQMLTRNPEDERREV